LVFEHGLRAVTMSQVAEETGIGRATLYKYFPDIDSILAAWHSREIGGHLHQLAEVRDRAGDPGAKLRAVLTAYALIVYRTRGHHDAELVRLLHHDDNLGHAQQQIRRLIGSLIVEAAAAGPVRSDISPEELGEYCLHALSAAGSLSSEAATRRLVQVTLNGLSRPGDSGS
ncbi:MAG: TetR/AcrR family transcriptional regulator, partial [Catenulispora sp.]